MKIQPTGSTFGGPGATQEKRRREEKAPVAEATAARTDEVRIGAGSVGNARPAESPAVADLDEAMYIAGAMTPLSAGSDSVHARPDTERSVVLLAP